MSGIELNGFPTQGTPSDPKDHPATDLSPYPNGVRTINIGDYTMPQMGKPSDYPYVKNSK